MYVSRLVTIPSLQQHHSPKTQNVLPTCCMHKQNKLRTNRRTTLTGLGSLIAFTTTQSLMDNGVLANGSNPSPTQALPEFGSEPRSLNETIRVIVPRPKRSESGFSKAETVEVLRVEGVELPIDDSVRFDVYVGKPGQVGSDLGEFAGSLVDLALSRKGNTLRKMGLSLGITRLVENIGAGNCEEVVVSLVPRSGNVSVGGVRIEHIKAE
ncbi:hypothetical protein IFM89_002137 [Coptis chinensis]|uniref:Polyphenol oxidase C-terminal domain-containing protein n=1 Tax=Coptis chinensis TaxID=261450 RepID=A0A835L9U1_9MAGN|nr:hypothetical protein IFM89_002137 [Coptis chinensis]